MAKQVRDVMTPNPITLQSTATLQEAARQMQTHDVGSLIVEESGALCGIITDRDIALRAVALGSDPTITQVKEICSKKLETLSADDDVDTAVRLMGDKAIRRIPVVDRQGKAVGIVSLGDLAVERDAKSVLGQISAAAPNN